MIQQAKKVAKKSIVSHLASGIFLSMGIIFSGFTNGGDNIRGTIWYTILLHILVFVPIEFFFLSMIINGYLKKNWRDVANILCVLLLSIWYIHVTDLFFRSSNDGRSKSTLIWIAHVVILIEAFGIFCVEFGFTILFAILGVIMGVMVKKELNKNKRNKTIKNMLINIATMKFNPSLHSEDECIICMENYNEEQEIIQLPCNIKHYFHSNCITQWVEKNASCPICKSEITDQILNDARQNYVNQNNRDSDLEIQEDVKANSNDDKQDLFRAMEKS